MNFGNYSLITYAEHRFEKEQDWYWRFKPTTSMDEARMASYAARIPQMIERDGNDAVVEWLYVAWGELSYSFGGTNIPGEDGEPILHEDATPEEVEGVLRTMPMPMVLELWKALGKANPLWGPRVPPEESEDSKKSSES